MNQIDQLSSAESVPQLSLLPLPTNIRGKDYYT